LAKKTPQKFLKEFSTSGQKMGADFLPVCCPAESGTNAEARQSPQAVLSLRAAKPPADGVISDFFSWICELNSAVLLKKFDDIFFPEQASEAFRATERPHVFETVREEIALP